VPNAVIRSNAAPPPDAARSSSAARIVDNAFRVLGLTPRASWPEVARTAEALLAALEAGDVTASSYDTPLGPQTRSEGAVRVARARLRDPDERIQQEIWWEAPRRRPAASWSGPPETAPADDWISGACDALGPSAAGWTSHTRIARGFVAPRAIGERPTHDTADPWPQAPAAWGWRPR
jgi:hypothetical protein